jgi:uncharacterized SAM-binding protein YcdF (DUF218 family)
VSTTVRPAGALRLIRSLGLGCVFLLGLVVLGYILLRGAGAFLITGDRIKKVDAVVVLGSGDMLRAREGARLVLEGYAGWLVLTEPGELEPGQGLGSQFFRSEAISSGLSEHHILITEEVSVSTIEEAQAVLNLMRQRGFKSVIVVTEPYHTQRTRLIFRRAFDETGFTVRVYPVQGHWYRSSSWFLSLEGWGNTIREYGKLAGFLFGVAF